MDENDRFAEALLDVSQGGIPLSSTSLAIVSSWLSTFFRQHHVCNKATAA